MDTYARTQVSGTGEDEIGYNGFMKHPMFFDTVARLYDTVRPPFSPLLVDDVRFLSHLDEDSSVLDVGCGTGKSTEPFAKIGYKVCALDPGLDMLAVCKERLLRYSNVTYEHATLDDWQDRGRHFNLIVGGNPFHWLDEAAKQRLLRIAKQDGAVAVFWHTFLNGQDSFCDFLDDIYREHAPELYVTDLLTMVEMRDREREERLLAWDGLIQRRTIRYYDQAQYDAEGYVSLLRTWPDHAHLPDQFFAAIASAIQSVGGLIVKPIRTTLVFGRRGA